MSDISHLAAFVDPIGYGRIQSSVDSEQRVVLPVQASGDITLGTIQTLSRATDVVSVTYTTSPVQIAGDTRGRGPILANETFATDSGWTHDATWTLAAGAAASASSTSLVQPSVLTIEEYYLVVYGLTNTLGTVAAYLGTTALTARGGGGVTGKVYAEINKCVGNTNFSLTPAALTGSVPFVYCFPLGSPFDICQLQPRAYSRIAAVVVGGNTVAPLDAALQNGIWLGFLRTS